MSFILLLQIFLVVGEGEEKRGVVAVRPLDLGPESVDSRRRGRGEGEGEETSGVVAVRPLDPGPESVDSRPVVARPRNRAYPMECHRIISLVL